MRTKWKSRPGNGPPERSTLLESIGFDHVRPAEVEQPSVAGFGEPLFELVRALHAARAGSAAGRPDLPDEHLVGPETAGSGPGRLDDAAGEFGRTRTGSIRLPRSGGAGVGTCKGAVSGEAEGFGRGRDRLYPVAVHPVPDRGEAKLILARLPRPTSRARRFVTSLPGSALGQASRAAQLRRIKGRLHGLDGEFRTGPRDRGASRPGRRAASRIAG